MAGMEMNRASRLETQIGTLLTLCAVVWNILHRGHQAAHITDLMVAAGAIGAVMVLHAWFRDKRGAS